MKRMTGLLLVLLLAVMACNEDCKPIDYSQSEYLEASMMYKLTDGCWFSEYYGDVSCPDDPFCRMKRNSLSGSHVETNSQGCPIIVEGEKLCDTYCTQYSKTIDDKIYRASGCNGETGDFFDDWKKQKIYIHDTCGWGAYYWCNLEDIYTCENSTDDGGLLEVRRPLLRDCGEKGCIAGQTGYGMVESMTPAFCIADEGPDAEDWPWESPNPKKGCPYGNPDVVKSGNYFPCPAKTFCHNDVIYGCTVVEDDYGCPQETYVWEIKESSEPCGDYWVIGENE